MKMTEQHLVSSLCEGKESMLVGKAEIRIPDRLLQKTVDHIKLAVRLDYATMMRMINRATTRACAGDIAHR